MVTNDKGYIEKERKFRDRSKKRRLTAEEKAAEKVGLRPKHQPYKRNPPTSWEHYINEEE